ncbi:hypothetical protein PM082_016700 [Marasmius tenuissimus]|nr:hypothetical protein PM082_016700 [Marasmius tenuissimus]
MDCEGREINSLTSSRRLHDATRVATFHNGCPSGRTFESSTIHSGLKVGLDYSIQLSGSLFRTPRWFHAAGGWTRSCQQIFIRNVVRLWLGDVPPPCKPRNWLKKLCRNFHKTAGDRQGCSITPVGYVNASGELVWR